MPLIFSRSLINTAGSQSAAAQVATGGIPNGSFTGTNKFGGLAFSTEVSGTGFDSGGSFTVNPKDANFYLNGQNAWTIEFWLANNGNGAPSPGTPAGIFRLEGDVLGGSGIYSGGGPRIIQFSDGVSKFRVYVESYAGDFNYSSLTWRHYALSSNGSNQLRWRVDGGIAQTWTYSNSTQRRTFYIGQKVQFGANNSGRILLDDLRVSTIDRYAAGYSQQAAQWETDEYTLALFHMNGNFTDSSQG